MKTLTILEIIDKNTFVKDGLITVGCAIKSAEEYAAQFQQKDVKPLAESNKCLNCGVPNEAHGTCCGWQNAKSVISYGENQRPAPSKTLQEMLEADFPMLSKEKWQELDLEDRPGKFFVDYLMIINERRNFCTKYFNAGQSSPSLSKGLVENASIGIYAEIAQNNKDLKYTAASSVQKDMLLRRNEILMKYLTELNQLTNGK